MTDALAGQLALVTGAGRGLGRACAEGLANAGARVIAVARSEDDLAAVAAHDGQGHALPFAQAVQAGGAHAGRVHHHVRPALGRHDEPVAFVRIIPLDPARQQAGDLDNIASQKTNPSLIVTQR